MGGSWGRLASSGLGHSSMGATSFFFRIIKPPGLPQLGAPSFSYPVALPPTCIQRTLSIRIPKLNECSRTDQEQAANGRNHTQFAAAACWFTSAKAMCFFLQQMDRLQIGPDLILSEYRFVPMQLLGDRRSLFFSH